MSVTDTFSLAQDRSQRMAVATATKATHAWLIDNPRQWRTEWCKQASRPEIFKRSCLSVTEGYPVSEMTYTVSSGTLNSTIHTCLPLRWSWMRRWSYVVCISSDLHVAPADNPSVQRTRVPQARPAAAVALRRHFGRFLISYGRTIAMWRRRRQTALVATVLLRLWSHEQNLTTLCTFVFRIHEFRRATLDFSAPEIWNSLARCSTMPITSQIFAFFAGSLKQRRLAWWHQ